MLQPMSIVPERVPYPRISLIVMLGALWFSPTYWRQAIIRSTKW